MRVDGLKAQHLNVRIDWCFSDIGRHFKLNLQHGALTWSSATHDARGDLGVTLSRQTLDRILCADTGFQDAVIAKEIQLSGKVELFRTVLETLDKFDGDFNVVEP